LVNSLHHDLKINKHPLKTRAELVTDGVAAMNSANRPAEKKPSFVLKEFLAQKDKSTNDAVVSLRPNMYALAKTDDAEAKLKQDTIGIHSPIILTTTGYPNHHGMELIVRIGAVR